MIAASHYSETDRASFLSCTFGCVAERVHSINHAVYRDVCVFESFGVTDRPQIG